MSLKVPTLRHNRHTLASYLLTQSHGYTHDGVGLVNRESTPCQNRDSSSPMPTGGFLPLDFFERGNPRDGLLPLLLPRDPLCRSRDSARLARKPAPAVISAAPAPTSSVPRLRRRGSPESTPSRIATGLGGDRSGDEDTGCVTDTPTAWPRAALRDELRVAGPAPASMSGRCGSLASPLPACAPSTTLPSP